MARVKNSVGFFSNSPKIKKMFRRRIFHLQPEANIHKSAFTDKEAGVAQG